MFCKVIFVLVAIWIVDARIAPSYHMSQIVPQLEDHIKYTDDIPEDYYGHPKYKYSYGVEDFKTGDYKTHKEEREGDVVKGEYTVADPDGSIRTVRYTVDKHSGFQAVVTTQKGEHDANAHYDTADSHQYAGSSLYQTRAEPEPQSQYRRTPESQTHHRRLPEQDVYNRRAPESQVYQRRAPVYNYDYQQETQEAPVYTQPLRPYFSYLAGNKHIRY